MTILAGTIILTLDNTGIIDKASETVQATNLKDIETLASIAWAEAYIDGATTQQEFEDKVIDKLKQNGITEQHYMGYKLVITTEGVELVSNNNDEQATAIIHSGIIPQGGKYIQGVTAEYTYDVFSRITSVTYDYSNAKTYESGDAFPENVNTGDIYQYGDYEYCYNEYRYVISESEWAWVTDASQSGWGCAVRDSSKSSYGEIITSIAGENVTSMFATFEGCTALTIAPTIPSSIISMRVTFRHCTSLITVPVLPSGVTDMDYTFYGCTALTTVPTIPASVTNMEYTFYECTSLATAPEILGRVTSMLFTFGRCSSLIIAPAIPSSVTSMRLTFDSCTSLTIAPTIPSSVTDLFSTFNGCSSLKTYVGSKDAPGDFSGYVIPNGVTNMYFTFASCKQLTMAPTIPTSVTNMSGTFVRCTSLPTAPTIPSSVTDMSSTFSGCSSLITAPTTIPSSVTDMSSTFKGCSLLKTVPTIPGSVTDMAYTFSGCTSLTGEVVINANPTKYTKCFENVDFTAQKLTLGGTSTMLETFGTTGVNYQQ